MDAKRKLACSDWDTFSRVNAAADCTTTSLAFIPLSKALYPAPAYCDVSPAPAEDLERPLIQTPNEGKCVRKATYVDYMF
jgi:hypothetical protein